MRGGITDRRFHCAGWIEYSIGTLGFERPVVIEPAGEATSYTRRSGKRLVTDPPADDPTEALTGEEHMERVYGRRA